MEYTLCLFSDAQFRHKRNLNLGSVNLWGQQLKWQLKSVNPFR